MRPMQPLLDLAADAGVFSDFDGTLSDIVDEPSRAVPVDGAAAVLSSWPPASARVGVLSGRPVSFLARWFGPGVLVSGLYGLELVVDGQRLDHPLGGVWREVVDDVVDPVRRPGARRGCGWSPRACRSRSTTGVDPNGSPMCAAGPSSRRRGRGWTCAPPACPTSCTHPSTSTRARRCSSWPTTWPRCASWATTSATCPRSTLWTAWPTQGVATVRIGVRSPEAAAELLERADVVVDGPGGAVELLQALAAAS